jgi:hypothetical protein
MAADKTQSAPMRSTLDHGAHQIAADPFRSLMIHARRGLRSCRSNHETKLASDPRGLSFVGVRLSAVVLLFESS